MGAPLLYGPILDHWDIVRGRPQPLRHPRLEAYQPASLKKLSAYCYTCDSRVMGAEVLLHLFFGELACKYCYHSIKSCAAFRTDYPMSGLCKGSSGDHNACRWVVPTCKYLTYHTRRNLSIAYGINNKFSKAEVLRAASIYLRGVLPLRRMYPWRSALKTVAKAGIAVDFTNLPPRLKRERGATGECKEESGRVKAMLGVSGLVQLEKSIVRLEKRKHEMSSSPHPPPEESESPPKEIKLENTYSSTENMLGMSRPMKLEKSILRLVRKKHNTSTLPHSLPQESESPAVKTEKNTHFFTEDPLANTHNTFIKTENFISTQNTFIKTENPFITTQNTPGTPQNTLAEEKHVSPESTLSDTHKTKKRKLVDTPADTQDTPADIGNTPSKKKLKSTPADSNNYPASKIILPRPRKKTRMKNNPAGTENILSEALNTPANLENTINEQDTPAKTHKKSKKKKLNDIFTDSLDTASEVPNTPADTEDTLPKPHKKKKSKNASSVAQNTPSEVPYASPDTEITPAKPHKKNKKMKVKNKSSNTINTCADILSTPSEVPNTSSDIEVTVPKHKKRKKVKNNPANMDHTPASMQETPASIENILSIEKTPAKKHKKSKKIKMKVTSASTVDAFSSTASTSASTTSAIPPEVPNVSADTNITLLKPWKKQRLKNTPANPQDFILRQQQIMESESTLPDMPYTSVSREITPAKVRKKAKKARLHFTLPEASNIPANLEITLPKPKKKVKLKNTPALTPDTPTCTQNTSDESQIRIKKKKRKHTPASTPETPASTQNTSDELQIKIKKKKRKQPCQHPKHPYQHTKHP